MHTRAHCDGPRYITESLKFGPATQMMAQFKHSVTARNLLEYPLIMYTLYAQKLDLKVYYIAPVAILNKV
jgi:hypothetical protein